MGASDRLPVPLYGVAYEVTFELRDADGELITGAAFDSGLASGSGKALLRGDNDTPVNSTNSITEIARGSYSVLLTSTETQQYRILVWPITTTSGAVQPQVNDVRPVRTTSIPVNVATIDSQEADASGTVTFPAATLASTTNITAATGVELASAYDAAKTAAQAGDQMDLVDAPNATAITAIRADLEREDGLMDTIRDGVDALPTAGENADQLLSELEGEHLSPGTIGAAINATRVAATDALLMLDTNGAIRTLIEETKASTEATPAAVWSAETRTLTSFGQLATDLAALAAKFTGITSLAQWLGLIAGKQVGDSTARTELRATGAGSGTYDETTDSLEALRDSTPTAAAIADAVHDEQLSGHQSAGSAGKSLSDAAADIYVAQLEFNRDSVNERDEYSVTWFKNGVAVTSGITSPTIQVVSRSDGTDLIGSTAMAQVGSTGSYKYDESDDRTELGESYLVLVGATIDGSPRTWRKWISRDTNT